MSYYTSDRWVNVKVIIDGNFDKTFLNIKIQEADQTILEYKKLKLGLL